jgi:hypothetical protein
MNTTENKISQNENSEDLSIKLFDIFFDLVY